MGDEPDLLPDVGDLLAPERGARGTVEAREIDAVELDRAGVGELEPGEQVQERRLSRARRPRDGVQDPRPERRASSPSSTVVAPNRFTSPRARRRPALRPDGWCQALRCLALSAWHLSRARPTRRRVDRLDDHAARLEARGRAGADAGAEQQLLGQPQPAATADDDRVGRLAVARPLLGDAAVADPDDAVGDPRGLRVVADDHGRAPVLAHELGERRVHLVGGRRVELAGRLVGEEHARPVRERRAERDALLLAARELRRQAVALLARGRRAPSSSSARRRRSDARAPRRPSCTATSSRAVSSGESARV